MSPRRTECSPDNCCDGYPGSGDYQVREDQIVTITFSAPVDFTVDNWQANTDARRTWGDGGRSFEFTANTGSWTVNNSAPTKLNFTGVGTNVLRGSTIAGQQIVYHEEWGDVSISGVTTITFNTGTTAGAVDGYNFSAVEAVPEPSSTALLGLGAFALMLRRRK